jgi:hypothetical protein
VKTLGKGIKAVIGFKKGGGSQIQSILFPRGSYDLKSAKSWVSSHGYKVHETLLVKDIDFVIDPKTLDFVALRFVEETVNEEEEAQVPRPKKNAWDWMLDNETELSGEY